MVLRYSPINDVINSWYCVGGVTATECIGEPLSTPDDADYIVGYSRKIADIRVVPKTAGVAPAPIPIGGSIPGGSVINPGGTVLEPPEYDFDSIIATLNFGTIANPNTPVGWKVRLRAKRNIDTFPLPTFRVLLSQQNNVVWTGYPQETDYGHGVFKTFDLDIDQEAIEQLTAVASGEPDPHYEDFENIRITLQFINNWTNATTIEISNLGLITPSIQGDFRYTGSSLEVVRYNGGTRFHHSASSLEVLGKKSYPRLTGSSIEVLAKVPEQDALHHSASSIEVLASQPRFVNTAESLEVIGKAPYPKITHSSIEVLASYSAPVSEIEHTASSIEVLATRPAELPTQTIGHTFSSLEVMAKYAKKVLSPINYLYIPGKLFLADWSRTIANSTVWETSISQSTSKETEQRLSLLSRPFRETSVQLFGLLRDEAVKLVTYLREMGERGLPFPFYSDATKLTQQAEIGSIFLKCDTTYRRIYKGQRVCVVNVENNKPTILDFYIVDSVSDSMILLRDPIKYTFLKGARIYPCIDIERVTEASLTPLNNSMYGILLEAQERIGSSTLFAHTDTKELTTYNGKDIFSFFNSHTQSARQGTNQIGGVEKLGKGRVDTSILEKPKDTYSGTLTFTDRSSFFDYLGFFNKHRGRARQFIFPIPQPFFNLVEYNEAYLRLHTYQLPFSWMHFMIAIHMKDGKIYTREISTVAEVDDNTYQVNWFVNEPLSLTEAGIRYIGLAYYARYSVDYLAENWVHNNLVTVDYSVIKINKDNSYGDD